MGVSQIFIDRIKTRLQEKRIPYREVARQLSVAESTIKRWFSSGNLSLNQLDQLCELLGWSIEDLIGSHEMDHARSGFDKKQEDFLADNEKALVVFYLITGGLKPKQILQAFGFSSAELLRLLIQLDKTGLIELGSGDRVRALKKIDTWWNPQGPLSRKYSSMIKTDFFMSEFSKDREAQWFFSGSLTASTQKIISKKINALAREIADYYRLDENENGTKNITMFIGMRPWTLPVIEKYRKKYRAGKSS